ncbi:MAG: hypothetical protein ACXAC7_08080 [Candidatus Hodarchaeales archaeon]
MENPLKFIIEPDTWTTGAVLRVPTTFAPIEPKFTMVICSSPAKLYSFCVQVTKKEEDSSLDKPIIQVDKNLVGPLQTGEEILLLEYNKPPLAKQVTMVISDRYRMPEGNWGNSIVNPAMLNHVMDLGSPVEFMYGTQQPTLIQAIVKSTVPKAPAQVDENTIFFVEKLDKGEIGTIQAEADKQKEDRAQAYIEQLKTKTFDFISSIRNESADKFEKTFHFNAAPKSIYTGIKQALGLFQIITDDLTEMEDGSFIGTLVAIPKTTIQPGHLFEFQIRGKMMQGNVSFWGFSLKIGDALAVSRDWEKRIRGLTQSMKEVPQAIVDVCQACDTRLDVSQQNEKGLVKCTSCNSFNQLPISLRSF